MKLFYKDKLEVRVYADRAALGRAAAEEVGARVRALLASGKGVVNMVFAAAPSQNEFLAVLAASDVDWGRVNAFHMDEYIGLDAAAPQGFGNFLRERLFSKLSFREVFFLDGGAADTGAECRRYADLLRRYPADVAAMGIGENTHLAFNDPHVASFDDPAMVKVVELDGACRAQQVADGCFGSIDEVPADALTLTIPALMQADYVYAMVPGRRKAEAVRHTLEEEIGERYPATILRRHARAVLFLDEESAEEVMGEREKGA